MKLTVAQQEVIDRLRAGWQIRAILPNYMTEWVAPDGARTGAACSITTLHAMCKKNVVMWVDGKWKLTNKAPANSARYTGRGTMIRHDIEIKIRQCFDPDAAEEEFRTYNYIARVEVCGHWREKFFNQLADALPWAHLTASELAKKTMPLDDPHDTDSND